MPPMKQSEEHAVPLHTRPAPQLVPLTTAGCWQLPEPSQGSLVQGLPSSGPEAPRILPTPAQPPMPSHVEDVSQLVAEQVYAVPPQTPLVHTSVFVQRL